MRRSAMPRFRTRGFNSRSSGLACRRAFCGGERDGYVSVTHEAAQPLAAEDGDDFHEALLEIDRRERAPDGKSEVVVELMPSGQAVHHF